MSLDDTGRVSHLDRCGETSTETCPSSLLACVRADSRCDSVDELKSRRSECPERLEADWEELDPVCERSVFLLLSCFCESGSATCVDRGEVCKWGRLCGELSRPTLTVDLSRKEAL